MKLGEIKLESLMMIFPGEALNVDLDNLNDALGILKADSNFSDYLAAMPGTINRCFGVLENKGVLPTKQVEIPQTEEQGAFVRCDLKSLAPDYGVLEKVAFEGEGGACYCSACEYTRESADVVLLPKMGKGKYIVIYTPRYPRVSLLNDENTEILAEREDIACLISYFVKSELAYTEYPDDAKLARQLFEDGLRDLASHKESYQGDVETVYRVI